MKKVFWSFGTESFERDNIHPPAVAPLIAADYYPYISLVKDINNVRKGETFLKCPANGDFLKNTYAFLAPFDLTIELEINSIEDTRIYCENINQDVFNKLIDIRFLQQNDKGKSPYPLIGIDWLNTFTSKTPMLLQLLPAFLHYNDFTSKATVIPGQYDISKWTRPVELVFEVKNSKERIVIKKGDVIAYFKFYCDEPIKLIEQPIPWDETITCTELRNATPFRPLKDRYDALDKVRKNQCPYDTSD